MWASGEARLTWGLCLSPSHPLSSSPLGKVLKDSLWCWAGLGVIVYLFPRRFQKFRSLSATTSVSPSGLPCGIFLCLYLTIIDLPICISTYLSDIDQSSTYRLYTYLSSVNLSMPFYPPLYLPMSTCICLWCHSSVFLLIYLCICLSISSVTITLFIQLLPIYHLSTYLSCLPLYLSTSLFISFLYLSFY